MENAITVGAHKNCERKLWIHVLAFGADWVNGRFIGNIEFSVDDAENSILW